MEYQILDAIRHINEQDEQEGDEMYCNECNCSFPERYLVIVRPENRLTASHYDWRVCSKECAKLLKESLESEGEEKFKIII